MNLKKFLHDHIPFLPHGFWKKAAEAIGRKPQNFNEKSGWPHMVSKLKEAEKVLDAWGYKLVIINKGEPNSKKKITRDIENIEDAIVRAISEYYEGYIPGELYEFVNFIKNYKESKKLVAVPYFEGLAEDSKEDSK